MNWRSPSLKVLGLTPKEIPILNGLSEARSLQELSGICSYSRTSIAYSLKGLLKRGLIEKQRHGRRFKYLTLPFAGVGTLATTKNYMPTGEKISLHHGLETVIELQRSFLAAHANERVMGGQSNKAWRTLHSKVSPDAVMRVNSIIRENKLVLDAIIEQDAYEVFNTVHRDMPSFADLAKSFGDRMADYAFAPKGFFTGNVELWIMKDTTLFINWHKEMAVKIADQDITDLMKDMFRLSKEDRAKVDHNQAIRRLVR